MSLMFRDGESLQRLVQRGGLHAGRSFVQCAGMSLSGLCR